MEEASHFPVEHRPRPLHVHKPARRLSPDDRQRIVALYLVPTRALEIAEQFGISKASVLHLLHAEGVDVRPRGTRIGDVVLTRGAVGASIEAEPMVQPLTFSVHIEIETPLLSAQDLADLSDLRRPLQALPSVSVGSGMNLERMKPGVPYNHIDLSQLVVTPSAAVSSTALTSVIVEWLCGRSDRRAKLRLGDNEIEFLRADDAIVEKLMTLFEEAVRSDEDHETDGR